MSGSTSTIAKEDVDTDDLLGFVDEAPKEKSKIPGNTQLFVKKPVNNSGFATLSTMTTEEEKCYVYAIVTSEGKTVYFGQSKNAGSCFARFVCHLVEIRGAVSDLLYPSAHTQKRLYEGLANFLKKDVNNWIKFVPLWDGLTKQEALVRESLLIEKSNKMFRCYFFFLAFKLSHSLNFQFGATADSVFSGEEVEKMKNDYYNEAFKICKNADKYMAYSWAYFKVGIILFLKIIRLLGKKIYVCRRKRSLRRVQKKNLCARQLFKFSNFCVAFVLQVTFNFSCF